MNKIASELVKIARSLEAGPYGNGDGKTVSRVLEGMSSDLALMSKEIKVSPNRKSRSSRAPEANMFILKQMAKNIRQLEKAHTAYLESVR